MSIELPKFKQEEIAGGRSLFAPLINRTDPSPNQFAFLVHPRDMYDELACLRIAGIDPSFLAKFVSPRMEQWLKNKVLYKSLAKMPPFYVGNGQIRVEGSEVRSNLVAVLLYGEQMLSNGWRSFAQERITEAIKMAKDGGARLVGLGAHTSPAVLGGKLLRTGSERLLDIADIGITNGNAFTAAVSVQSVKDWTGMFDLKPSDTKVGVVGATGSVGNAISYLLVEEGYKPILNGRAVKKIKERFSQQLGDEAEYSENPYDLRECDIVVVTTSGAESTVFPEHISPGTVVIEDTQPRNIREETAEIIRKNGGLVIDGGFVRIPGYKCDFPLRLPDETAFACFAEGYILATEGRFSDYSIGNAESSKAREMMELAKKHNISPAPITWNSRPIDDETIEEILHANRERRMLTSFSKTVS